MRSEHFTGCEKAINNGGLCTCDVEPRWVDVTKRLPKDNHYPLLTAAQSGRVGVSTFQTAWYSQMKRCWYAYPSDQPFRLSDVTHWMELDFLEDPNGSTQTAGRDPE